MGSNSNGGGNIVRFNPQTYLPSAKRIQNPSLPTTFVPIPGPQRIVESRCHIDEGGRAICVKVYEPPLAPVPWTARAWYDMPRAAHVIEVSVHPLCEPGAVSAKVYVGAAHQANRALFAQTKEPLWPDDKVSNRVVHRAPRTQSVCFLIEIRAYDLCLDFFHEPFDIDGLALTDDTPKAAKRFAQMKEIDALEQMYAAERAKLEERSDLSPMAKHLRESHLMRIYEELLGEIVGET